MLMEVIVTYEHEKVFAQAKIETHINDGTAMKSPTAIDPHGAEGQWRPTNISVNFRMTPTNPSRAPSQIRHPQPTVSGIPNPPTIVERDIAPIII